MTTDAAAKRKQGVAKLRRYLEPDGPLVFVVEQFFREENFHAMTPTADRSPDIWQKKMLLAFGELDAAGKARFRRMAAAACKGPGKTALMAWIGWYFLATRPNCKVPCISITGGNLKDGLWAEFKKWQLRSPLLLREFTWFAERITHNKYPATWFASKRSWSPDADPQQQANDIAGLHEDYLLWLIDECSDMPDGVVSAAEGALTSGIETRLVMMGNCTRSSGPLWNACGRDRHNSDGTVRWHITRITGDPDDPDRSPRIDITEARNEIAKRGRDDYRVMVNILGLFPEKAADALLGVRDVEAAQLRELGMDAYYREAKVIGCDVARFGSDDSIIFPRQGRAAFRPKVFHGLDTHEFAEQIIRFSDTWKADGGFVDGGGVGGGTVDSLRARGRANCALEVNFGSRAINTDEYENRRAEMYFLAAAWVKSGGCLPNIPGLAEELAAPKYWFNKKQQKCLEPKDDIKARLGRSPDLADAFVLTFAAPVMPKTLYVGAGANRERVSDREASPAGNHVTDN